MTAARKPQDPAKFRRYREGMKARGLKEVRLWLYDPSAPGFREEMARQAKLLRGAPEELEALEFAEAALEPDDWIWDEEPKDPRP